MKTLPHRNLIKEQLLDKDGDFDLDRFLRAYNDQQATVSTILGGGFRLTANGGAAVLPARLRIPAYPWTDATLNTGDSWANVGGFDAAGYLMMPGGMVHLRGLVTGGTSTTRIFTLPTGYVPANPKRYIVTRSGGTGEVEVQADGDVVLTAASTTNASLEGISFQVASAAAPLPFNWTDDGWKVKHGLGRCTGLVPLYAEVVGDNRNETVGQFTLEWKDRGDGTLAIRSAYGLAPGKAYNLRLLALSE